MTIMNRLHKALGPFLRWFLKALGPYWLWFFAALFFWLAVSFLGKAEASVLGQDSAESCLNAVDAIAAGNPPHGKQHATENDFHIVSNQLYYLMAGSQFRCIG